MLTYDATIVNCETRTRPTIMRLQQQSWACIEIGGVAALLSRVPFTRFAIRVALSSPCVSPDRAREDPHENANTEILSFEEKGNSGKSMAANEQTMATSN